MVTSIHSMARSGGPLLASPPPDYSNETLKFSHYLLSILSLTGGPGLVALHFVGDNDTFNLNLNWSLGKRNVHKYLLNIYGITLVVLTSTVWCCILSAVVMVVVYWAAVGGWRVMGAEEGKINICLVWDHRIGLGNNQANKNYSDITVNYIFHLTHGLLLLWLILS